MRLIFLAVCPTKLFVAAFALLAVQSCTEFVPSLKVDGSELAQEAVTASKERNSFWHLFRPTRDANSAGLSPGTTVVAQDQWVRAPVVSDVMPSEYPNDLVSISMRDVALREILEVMRSAVDVNMVVSSAVSGSTSVNIVDVPWRTAMETILASNQLGFRTVRGSNVLEIYTLSELSEIEAAELSRARQSVELKGLRDGETYQILTAFHRVRYASVGDVAQQVSQLFGTNSEDVGQGSDRFAPQLTIVPDTRTNSIMLRGVKGDVMAASNLLKTLDVPTQQVLIEAIVVEASQSFEAALGARLGVDLTRTGGASLNVAGIQGGAGAQALGGAAGSIVDFNPGGSNAGIGVMRTGGGASLRAEIRALQKEGITEIISNPRVYAVDNTEAKIFQGIEIAYESGGTDGGEPTFKEAGLSLTVTPTITGDGHVFLNVRITKDSPDYSQSSTTPSIDKSEISTRLLVEDGAIAVIGGIREESAGSNKQNLPGTNGLLRKVFSGSSKDNSEKELIIFLIPRIQ